MNNSLEQVRTPEIIAQEIRGYTGMMLNIAIEIGRRMCEVKAMLPHGEFGKWIEKTGHSVSSANNFMRLFNEYADDQITLFGAVSISQTFGNLSYTKALALLALPAEERETFAKENDVEGMSTRELREAIKERDAAIERAKKLEQDNADLEEKVYGLEEARDSIADALHLTQAELDSAREELKNRPIEAAITATDPEEVKTAVEAALAEAAKTHAAEMDEVLKKLGDSAKEKDKLEKKLLDAKNAAAKAEASAASGSEVYKAEAERARAEVERLRREVAMADPVTAEFKGLFEQASVIAAKLIRLASDAPEASAPNLRAALDALGKQISEGAK